MRRVRQTQKKELPGRVLRSREERGRHLRRKQALDKKRSKKGTGRLSHQATLLQMQQVHGNAFVSRYLTRSDNSSQGNVPVSTETGPAESPMSRIQDRARSANNQGAVAIALAGSPQVKGAPDGMAEILSKSSGGTIGVAGGLTIAYDDFKEPKLRVDVESKKEGDKEEFFAKLQPTSTRDAKHDSYYPGQGLHVRPGMTQTVGDKTFQYYWKIRPKIAELIKKGEQEHLNDHKRAYQLTYGQVEKTINALADKKIGPAKSAEEAKKKAMARLAAKLPKGLGVSPKKWHQTLIRLLKATEKRDSKRWHALDSEGPMVTKGTKRITVVGKATTTKIGKVPSKSVVKL